ncbi:MAG: YggT family protein [Ammonifex sp.]|jgi:YggT family protein|nr:MAG: YggT family protein [Ammonifex sp.]
MEFLFRAVNIAFWVYGALIIIRVVLSWVRHNPYQPALRFVYEVTDPYLNFFRRFIPPVGMIDLSPIVALFVLDLLQRVVFWSLFRLVGLL